MTPTRWLALGLRRAAGYAPVRRWIQRLGEEFRQQRSGSGAVSVDIPELMPLPARESAAGSLRRLNLLVPALSAHHLFGGIQTALDVFNALRPHFDTARIVVTDEAQPQLIAGAFYSAWPIVELDAHGPDCDHIVPAGDRWQKSLEVGAQDYFMATAWWTALAASEILVWQKQTRLVTAQRAMVYLVQDYEPGFYPWSTKFALARSTYSLPHPTVAILNSDWLRDYVLAQGHHFHSSYVLEPRIHPTLAAQRSSATEFHKKQQMLVYGRPGTERNAFPLLVAALRRWVELYPGATNWEIQSAGESFAPVDLGRGCVLQSLGKLSVQDYAATLSAAAVGVSLMVSPHPSYPPLEMAAFGARTITNSFANKDLSSVSTYLSSVHDLNAEQLAQALCDASGHFDALDAAGQVVKLQDIDWHGSYLQSGDNGWQWTAQVASDLLKNTN